MMKILVLFHHILELAFDIPFWKTYVLEAIDDRNNIFCGTGGFGSRFLKEDDDWSIIIIIVQWIE